MYKYIFVISCTDHSSGVVSCKTIVNKEYSSKDWQVIHLESYNSRSGALLLVRMQAATTLDRDKRHKANTDRMCLCILITCCRTEEYGSTTGKVANPARGQLWTCQSCS